MTLDARTLWAAAICAWLLYVNAEWLPGLAVVGGLVLLVWAVARAVANHLFPLDDG